MTKEELKEELERLKNFKVYVFEWDVYVKAEDYKEKAIENRKLKEINESQNEEIQRFKDNAMQDMREITELEIENRKLKDGNTILKKGWQVVFTLEKRIDELLEENQKLKSDLAYERTMLDNVRAEYKSSQNVIKKLKEELKKYKKLHKYSNWELLTYSGD